MTKYICPEVKVRIFEETLDTVEGSYMDLPTTDTEWGDQKEEEEWDW